MKKIFKFIPLIALLGIIFLIFKAWFLPGLISAGDLWPYSNSIYSSRSFIPFAWDLNNGDGLGMFVAPLLWIYVNFGLPTTILGQWLNLSWSVIERVWYLFPFLIFSFYFSKRLFAKIFSKNNFSLLSASIYTLNTYILMVVGGGQIAGIGIAYSIIPLILFIFIEVFENLEKNKKTLYKSVLAGAVLSAQSIFDIRITYITLAAIFVLWIFKILKNKNDFLKLVLFMFVVPGIIMFLLNAFWIIPTALSGRNPVQDMGSAYSSLSAVKFFSFAKLEDAISLLHPNWPENIFGKVGFLKPEFLLLPVLAFLSLSFLKKESEAKRTFVIFFASLGILGAFLAKGANDPFGSLYLWLFDHLPGFIMFRDSSKWYVLIALSYSMLIPYSLEKIYEFLKTKKSLVKFVPLGFMFAVIVYFLFLIRPAFLGQLNGTFKSVVIPSEYIKLEKYLSTQDNFFRTLWLPSTQRFAYYSNNHPAVPAQIYFNKQNLKDLINDLKSKDAEQTLEESSIKYVIIPYDSQGEIFLKDRKYDNDSYLKTIKDVSSITWLKRVSGFVKVAVFEVKSPKDHFWSDSKDLAVKYKYKSPVAYDLFIKNAKRGEQIIFSENYDLGWIVRGSKDDLSHLSNPIASTKYKDRFNSFVLNESGDYSINVLYFPQRVVNKGAFVSVVSLFILLLYLIIQKKKKT